LFFSKRKKYHWKEVEISYQMVQKSHHQINYFSYKPLKLGAPFYPDTLYNSNKLFKNIILHNLFLLCLAILS